jgi:anti-sigma regulatory factor (Ser/Thr protein kinase)
MTLISDHGLRESLFDGGSRRGTAAAVEDHVARERFAPTPESVHSARLFVHDVLGAWKLDSADLRQEAILLVSELATNAVLHGRTEFEVLAKLSPQRLRIEVADGNARPPSPVMVPARSTSGRGLAIVQQVSSAWGVEQHDAGKIVWFELPA